MENFTPIEGLIGGALIGLSAAFFLLMTGRVSGISGIMESALEPTRNSSYGWQYIYLAGLPLGALLVSMFMPQYLPKIEVETSWMVMAVAGFIAGYGARLGNGCTSGHGICGLPRLAPRSIVSTIIFMSVAALTVFVTRHVI